MLGGHVLVSRVEACLVVLARSERQRQPIRHGLGCRHGAGPARGAHSIPCGKAIPIPAVGLEPGDLDMHRMRQLRRGCGRARPHDLSERVVAGNLPPHTNVAIDPSAIQRIGRKARPEHEPVRAWIARGHAQRERIGGEGGPAVLPAAPRRSSRHRCQMDELASSECHAAMLHRKRKRRTGWWKRVHLGYILGLEAHE